MTHLEAIRFLFLDAGQAGFQRPKTLATAFRGRPPGALAPLAAPHVAPAKPTVVAPNAKVSPVRSARNERRRLGRAKLARFLLIPVQESPPATRLAFFARRGNRFVLTWSMNIRFVSISLFQDANLKFRSTSVLLVI